MILDFLLFGAGFVLLLSGADGLVRAAAGAAADLRVPAFLVGVLFVGFGTSLPELAVGVDAALVGAGDVAVGSVLGSNLCNGGLVLGLAAQEASVARGTLLLAVYAAGLGIPFLLVAAFLPRMGGLMGWMKRHMEQIERVMGLLLWTIGLLMLTGGFSTFSYWLLETFPALATLG